MYLARSIASNQAYSQLLSRFRDKCDGPSVISVTNTTGGHLGGGGLYGTSRTIGRGVAVTVLQ